MCSLRSIPSRLVGLLAVCGLASATLAAEPVVNSIGMKMISIPAGEFTMGSDLKPANWDELPKHHAAISSALLMSETEVTVEQYQQFKADAPLNKAYAPFAAGISWNDAVDFCAWLSKKEGKNYRLPTEAEWECACRAGRADGATWETTADQANPWGLTNMLAGPVEWCSDWYGEYDFANERDPAGWSGGLTKVVRGGYLDTPDKYKPADYLRPSNRAGAPPNFGPYADGSANPDGFGVHRIGFRVVQAAPVTTALHPYAAPYARQGVVASTSGATHGPDMSKPYFRRRPMLPIPPEDTKQDAINHTGLHPSFRDHNHSPGFTMLPNGDAFLIIYTSYNEYEPEVSLMSTRLRFGAEEWDMPSPMFDTPGANDHAPLLWNDGDTLWFFWGNPYAEGHFPFQYMSSKDFGASWTPVNYPHIVGELGPGRERPQPINTVIRDSAGTMYVPCDASGAHSILWATKDGGQSWSDTMGRTGGRHTTFVMLKDGRILGMGGKGSNIEQFMPKSISSDGGKTWEVSKTPFSWVNSGQRPCIIRLASGRLFMAGDYYPSKVATRAPSITEDGSYVALSDDDGANWRIKRLPGVFSAHRDKPSLGYCVARQAPNGVINLITTLNHPAYHFEINEAWILSDATFADDDPAMTQSHATTIAKVEAHEEKYPDSRPKAIWSSGVADDGRLLLQGKETWFYLNGARQREAEYKLGRKVGQETYWSAAGVKQWEWLHHEDGTGVWTTYWSDGSKRSESTWKNLELVTGSDKFYEHAAVMAGK